MNIDQIISREVKNLTEEKKQKEKKIKAKVGRGNIKSYIREGKARAESDPEGLLLDLGISPPRMKTPEFQGEPLIARIGEIVQRAIQINAVMQLAFVGARINEPNDVVVNVSEDVGSRDGSMYMNNVLRAAQNAEVLVLDNDINIEPQGSSNKVTISIIPS